MSVKQIAVSEQHNDHHRDHNQINTGCYWASLTFPNHIYLGSAIDYMQRSWEKLNLWYGVLYGCMCKNLILMQILSWLKINLYLKKTTNLTMTCSYIGDKLLFHKYKKVRSIALMANTIATKRWKLMQSYIYRTDLQHTFDFFFLIRWIREASWIVLSESA